MNIQNVTIVGFNPPTFGPKNKQNNAASTTTVPVAQIFCSQGYHTHKPKKERKTLRKFRLGAQIRMTNVASQVPKEVPQSLFLNYYQVVIKRRRKTSPATPNIKLVLRIRTRGPRKNQRMGPIIYEHGSQNKLRKSTNPPPIKVIDSFTIKTNLWFFEVFQITESK